MAPNRVPRYCNIYSAIHMGDDDDNKQSLDGGHQYGEVIARLL